PLHPLEQYPRRAGAFRSHQLNVIGRGRAWLRIWLFAIRTQCLDRLGSSVWRFRQWRAGLVRSIHFIWRTQVATHVGSRLPPAAWLRRPGAGTFLGAARTVSSVVRRGQYAGGELHDAGQLFSHLAASIEARHTQTASPDDAKIALAPQARGLDARR